MVVFTAITAQISSMLAAVAAGGSVNNGTVDLMLKIIHPDV
jgi:hypothetical protein